jgi:hypothetical protein
VERLRLPIGLHGPATGLAPEAALTITLKGQFREPIHEGVHPRGSDADAVAQIGAAVEAAAPAAGRGAVPDGMNVGGFMDYLFL